MSPLVVFLVLLVGSTLAAPPVDKSTPTALGTIQGSPVVAIVHGPSDIVKDDTQGKDTEDDPLTKFGKIVE